MVEKDEVRRSYDELAEVYADQRTLDEGYRSLLAAFIDGLPAGPTVLDAGSGEGTPGLARVAERGRLVGLDFSREQLRLASADAPTVEPVQGDMTTLPLERSAVDGVVAAYSLIHIPETDHQTVIDEFARVLRPGGRVLLTEGPEEWTGQNPDWLDSGVPMQWHIAGAETTRTQLERAGFSILREIGTGDGLEADASDDDGAPWISFVATLVD